MPTNCNSVIILFPRSDHSYNYDYIHEAAVTAKNNILLWNDQQITYVSVGPAVKAFHNRKYL